MMTGFTLTQAAKEAGTTVEEHGFSHA